MTHVKIHKELDGWHVENPDLGYELTGIDDYKYAIEVADSLVKSVDNWKWEKKNAIG